MPVQIVQCTAAEIVDCRVPFLDLQCLVGRLESRRRVAILEQVAGLFDEFQKSLPLLDRQRVVHCAPEGGAITQIGRGNHQHDSRPGGPGNLNHSLHVQPVMIQHLRFELIITLVRLRPHRAIQHRVHLSRHYKLGIAIGALRGVGFLCQHRPDRGVGPRMGQQLADPVQRGRLSEMGRVRAAFEELVMA